MVTKITSETVKAHVERLLRELVEQSEPLTPDTDLFADLAIDSLEGTELTARLAQEFGISLAIRDIRAWSTVGNVCEGIAQRISAAQEEREA